MQSFDFLNKSKEIHKKAGWLLEKSGLIEICKEYGDVIVGGSYRADIMIYPDLDITTVRKNNFSFDDSLEIVKKIYEQTDFASYFLGGDWNNPWNEEKEEKSESGKYIGLRAYRFDEKWNIDLWFISEKEHKKRQTGFFRDWISEPKITEDQKLLILKLKHHIHENGYNLSSNYIYDAVLNKNVDSFEEGLKYLNSFSDKVIV